MNLKKLVKLSNVIAVVAIVLLIYWVFVFVAVQVFGFKVFRQNISQTFAMSVLGILALMAGSLMINVMFNLTRIAERHDKDELIEAKSVSKKLLAAFLLSFPVILGLLYSGDFLNSIKKESMLIDSAKSVIEKYPQRMDGLLNYRFNKEWLIETGKTVELMRKTDKNFPSVVVIAKDSIDDSEVFLGIQYSYQTDENFQPEKQRYILETTKPERDYLNKVFNENYDEIRFSAADGNYQLFYPYTKDGKKIVLYFSDFQRYGKLGS